MWTSSITAISLGSPSVSSPFNLSVIYLSAKDQIYPIGEVFGEAQLCSGPAKVGICINLSIKKYTKCK